jgi:hypothetical protein
MESSSNGLESLLRIWLSLASEKIGQLLKRRRRDAMTGKGPLG